MPTITRVSGTEWDGSSIKLTIAKTQIPVISISYGDNLAPEWIYEMGSQIAAAQTPGQYKTTDGKLKVRSSVARVMIFPNLPTMGAGNAKTQAVVNYTHPDVGSDSDLLVDFRLLGGAASLEASAKATELELSFVYRLVKWTNKRITFGQSNGGGATGTLRL